ARSHAAEADAFEATGRNARERCALDGRCQSDTVDYGPPECGGYGFWLPGYRRVEQGDVDTSRVETRSGGTRMAEDTYERRAEDDEQDATRDLTDNEGAPEAGTSGRRPHAVLERCACIHAR